MQLKHIAVKIAYQVSSFADDDKRMAIDLGNHAICRSLETDTKCSQWHPDFRLDCLGCLRNCFSVLGCVDSLACKVNVVAHITPMDLVFVEEFEFIAYGEKIGRKALHVVTISCALRLLQLHAPALPIFVERWE